MVNNQRSYRAARCNRDEGGQKNNALMRKLLAVELALIETGLYLDSYPENKAALDYYRKLAVEYKQLIAEAERVGRPITQIDAGKNDTWNWISSPWPWMPEADL